jgi:2-polyprenyl-3-methyl-5-hydroxy-6-metoxy-1,4-benzoquinol methylase
MISPRPESAWFDEFYRKDYWPVYISSRFKDLDDMYIQDQCDERSRQIFEAIHPKLRYAPKNYLDVGCGQGAMLAEFRRRYPAATCVGVEPSADAAAFCFHRHGLQVNSCSWTLLDAEELQGPFDVITLIHVLEHVLDPVDVLTRAVDRLSPNGLIYVEVPDILSERWTGKDFFHIAHVWYFHETALRNAFFRCGLEVMDVIRGAADIWSWAIGFVGQKSLKKPQPPEAIPEATRDIKERLRAHVAAHGTVPRTPARRFHELMSPRKLPVVLRNLLVYRRK